jgi:hypothetical protein
MWIKVADPHYPDDPDFYADRMAVNAGFVFGSMEGFLIYYHVLLRQPFYTSFTPETIDQGYINFLYHKRVFEAAGLKLRVTYPGDYLVSVRGGKFEKERNDKGLFMMAEKSGIPAAIHQYNRICPLVAQLEKFCPPLPFDSEPYAVLKDVSQTCD